MRPEGAFYVRRPRPIAERPSRFVICRGAKGCCAARQRGLPAGLQSAPRLPPAMRMMRPALPVFARVRESLVRLEKPGPSLLVF